MALSPRLRWPVPDESQEPWYPTFRFMVDAQDASGFASREDRHIVFTGGGTFCFDPGTNNLSWSAPINILAAISGFFWTIPAGSIALLENQFAYVDLFRAPIQNTNVAVTTGFQVPNSDTALLFCLRKNNRVIFRTGTILIDECFRVFEDPREGVGIINMIPSPKDVSGTPETLIGAVYLSASEIIEATFLMGNQTLVHAATITVRRNTDSAILFTLGPFTGAITSRTLLTVPVVIPTVGWYEFFLQSNNTLGTSICNGIYMKVV